MKINLFLIFILVCSFKCLNNKVVESKKYNSILRSITETNRISSNHFSEVVTDSFGNSYIACFRKQNDNQDYIYISKIDRKGNVIWERGTDYQGRATSITITNRNSILVTGWAKKNLKLDDFEIKESDKHKVFIAEINYDGICSNLIKSNGDGFFNIECNENGGILVSGLSNSSLHLGSVFWEKDGGSANFIAHFDKELNSDWIKWFDGQVWQIKHLENNFFLTGSYSSFMVIGEDTLTTINNFDEDGFLTKISDNGNFNWSKRFGQSKNPKPGYKSREIGCGIAFNNKNEILVSANLNSEVTNDVNSLYVLIYNERGEFKGQHLLVERTNNTLSTIQVDNEGDYWISGNRKSNDVLQVEVNENTQSFIYEFSPEFQLKRKIEPKHKKNMLFRSSYYTNMGELVFTGHYQHFISIGKDTLQNSGQHELFYLNLNSNITEHNNK